MSDFDIAQYCGGDGSSEAICAVYDKALDIETGVNAFFNIFAGALVFMMQTGFAMLCAGTVRQKNVKNIMLKNLLDACGGAIGFYLLGYGIAFGDNGQTGSTFMGNANFALRDFNNWSYFFFQFSFAASAATIVAGAVAERCTMSAYLLYSLFLTGFVYPIIAHAAWDNNGFFSAFQTEEFLFRDVGVVDFAGSGVVHFTGGLTALLGAIVLGPRRNRFYDDDNHPLEVPTEFPPHSVALQVLGTFILWFGWYGFNPGSALAIGNSTSAEVAGLCAVTTTLGAAAGAITSMFVDSFLEAASTGEVSYDVGRAMNGCLGGLVAITSSTATITPWAALIVGGIGGIVYLVASKLLVKWRIDDVVDAVPVHMANGIWGIIAAGLFSKPELMELAGYKTEHFGLFYELARGKLDANLLLAQVLFLVFTTIFVTFLMGPFFIVLNKLGLLRVDPLVEDVGLDVSHHRGAAYDLTKPNEADVEELMVSRASKSGKIDIHPEEGGCAQSTSTTNRNNNNNNRDTNEDDDNA